MKKQRGYKSRRLDVTPVSRTKIQQQTHRCQRRAFQAKRKQRKATRKIHQQQRRRNVT
jgi:hypothetical protein